MVAAKNKLYLLLLQELFAAGSYNDCESQLYSAVLKGEDFLKHVAGPDFGSADGSFRVFSWFVNYIENADGDKLCKLCQFVTSIDWIPDGSPKIIIQIMPIQAQPKRLPRARTCGSQLELCLEYAAGVYQTDMGLAIEYSGFGSL